jgi:hypothetical protein
MFKLLMGELQSMENLSTFSMRQIQLRFHGVRPELTILLRPLVFSLIKLQEMHTLKEELRKLFFPLHQKMTLLFLL